MSFSNPFKKDASAPSADERIEPQIGSGESTGASTPWEVHPQDDVSFVDPDAQTPSEAGAPHAKKSWFGFAKKTPAAEPKAAPAAAVPQSEPLVTPVVEPTPESVVAEPVTRPKPAVPLTDEQVVARQKTRNRLVGAAVLLMAVIVAAPFILDNEADVTESELETGIPPVAQKEAFATLDDSLAAKSSSGDLNVTENATAPAASTAKAHLASEAQSAPAVKKAAPAVKKAAPAVTEKPAPAPAVSGHGYYVQLAAVGRKAGAQALVDKLKKQGFPAYMDSIQTRSGNTLWCVRIGLFKTQKQANSQKAALALNGYTGRYLVKEQ